MSPPFVRSPYNYDVDAASLESGLDCSNLPDLTVQSDKDDADINVLVRRFGVTGTMPQNVRAPLVGDFTGVTDFQTAMNAVNQANDSFLQMPAELRAKLGHDPARFVDWCADDKNREEMKKYGLLMPGDDPVVPPVVPPPAS